MCGINGAISINTEASIESKMDAKASIDLMNNILFHRGPDAGGVHIKGPVAFGFRRLGIIDLDHSANQPMHSNEGDVTIVFNGEIYNYLELRAQLIEKGYRFRTKSDTEVILNSYLEYGEDCLHHFNGMWAFAIYDFRKRRLFCSRDRLGVKPFYYAVDQGVFYFASELKALHAVRGFKEANLDKVYEYLAYGFRINDGETFFDGCQELLPGTILTIENGEIKLRKFWKLQEDMYDHAGSTDYKGKFTRLFENAVKLRYRSDVPVALLLSGGLDSTAIAKVTDDLIENGELGQNEIHAFIASFPGFEHDETQIARDFVKTCKHIRLHEMLIDSENVLDGFEELIHDLDHPLGSFASIAHNNIMKACKERGIKVVLNGQGSDEAYAGYDRYISGVHLLEKFLNDKKIFWNEFKDLNQKNGYSKPFLIAQMLKSTLNQPYASYLRAKYQEKSIACLDNEFVRNSRDHYTSEYQFSLKGDNFINYLLNVINHQGLNTILHYEDISSMHQSIEVRSPFMDYRLMEFGFSIPNETKFKGGDLNVSLGIPLGSDCPTTLPTTVKR